MNKKNTERKIKKEDKSKRRKIRNKRESEINHANRVIREVSDGLIEDSKENKYKN